MKMKTIMAISGKFIILISLVLCVFGKQKTESDCQDYEDMCSGMNYTNQKWDELAATCEDVDIDKLLSSDIFQMCNSPYVAEPTAGSHAEIPAIAAKSTGERNCMSGCMAGIAVGIIILLALIAIIIIVVIRRRRSTVGKHNKLDDKDILVEYKPEYGNGASPYGTDANDIDNVYLSVSQTESSGHSTPFGDENNPKMIY